MSVNIHKQAEALGLWIKIVEGQYGGKKTNYQIMKGDKSLATYSTPTQVKEFLIRYMDKSK